MPIPIKEQSRRTIFKTFLQLSDPPVNILTRDEIFSPDLRGFRLRFKESFLLLDFRHPLVPVFDHHFRVKVRDTFFELWGSYDTRPSFTTIGFPIDLVVF